MGKTQPAIALRVKAVDDGFSIAFFQIEDLQHELKKDAEVSPHERQGHLCHANMRIGTRTAPRAESRN